MVSGKGKDFSVGKYLSSNAYFLLFTISVTLGNSLTLLISYLSILLNGDNNNIYVMSYYEVNKYESAL